VMRTPSPSGVDGEARFLSGWSIETHPYAAIRTGLAG
jgi:hypothetical protein